MIHPPLFIPIVTLLEIICNYSYTLNNIRNHYRIKNRYNLLEDNMCGRITFTLDKSDLITIIKDRYDIDEDVDYDLPRYNIAPTNQVLAIINDGKKNRIGTLKWGYVPHWAKDNKFMMINAKAETVHEKSMFKDAFKRQRCIILADGFYEWQKIGNTKLPYRITLTDSKLMVFAGLWTSNILEDGTKQYTCTILTTTPNDLMRNIHDRMPVILNEETEKLWLNPHITDVDVLKSLLVPYPEDKMTAYRVSDIVNNARYDSIECIKPLS